MVKLRVADCCGKVCGLFALERFSFFPFFLVVVSLPFIYKPQLLSSSDSFLSLFHPKEDQNYRTTPSDHSAQLTILSRRRDHIHFAPTFLHQFTSTESPDLLITLSEYVEYNRHRSYHTITIRQKEVASL